MKGLLNLKIWIAQKDVRKYLFGFTNNIDQILCVISPPNISDLYSIHERFLELGYLKVLKWIHKANKYLLMQAHVCAYAARCGHLEVLQWVRDNGAPWNERTCANAARRGHLEILQ